MRTALVASQGAARGTPSLRGRVALGLLVTALLPVAVGSLAHRILVFQPRAEGADDRTSEAVIQARIV